MQLQDTELQELVKKINDNDKEIRKCYVLDHGRLYKVHNGGKLWIVPKSLRYKIAKETHEREGQRSNNWENATSNVIPSHEKFCKIVCEILCPMCIYHYGEVDPVPFKTPVSSGHLNE